MSILSSPRSRRRLILVAAGAAFVGVLAGIVLLVPESKPPKPGPSGKPGSAQLARPVSRHVSKADRRAIDETLDRFFGAGLSRRSIATAWRLSGPGLKGGSTLREWKRGSSPIPYYPPREKRFHSWTVIDAGPRFVDLNILVHPAHGAKTSSSVFSTALVKRGGRWLVNGLYTVAIMKKPTKTGQHEIGPADFAAPPPAAGRVQAPAALSKIWLLAVVGVLALALLFALGFGLASVWRDRRLSRRHGGGRSRELPPLPTSFRRE